SLNQFDEFIEPRTQLTCTELASLQVVLQPLTFSGQLGLGCAKLVELLLLCVDACLAILHIVSHLHDRAAAQTDEHARNQPCRTPARGCIATLGESHQTGARCAAIRSTGRCASASSCSC